MPQLDTVTFLPQVFWLLLIFTVYFLLVDTKVIPTLSTVLKVRSKKFNHQQELVNSFGDENNSLQNEYKTTFVNALNESRNLLQDSTSEASNWSSATGVAVKESQASISYLFMEKVTEISANKNYLGTLIKKLS